MPDAGAEDGGGADAGASDASVDAEIVDMASDAGAVDMDSDDLGGLPCNPLDHAGCAAGERCAWVRVSMLLGAGELRCVPAGPVAEGDACTVGPDGETTGFDDCARGLHCVSGACRRVCELGTSCGADLCVVAAGLFLPPMSSTPVAGICLESCDPVTQRRLDGSACGVGRGCFGSVSDAVFSCGPAYSMLGHGETIVGFAYANACAAGFTPFGRSLDERDLLCAAFCRPVETHSGAPAGAAGAAPYACPDRGAGSPPNECLFAAGFATDPIDPRFANIGVCFDRTGRLYDADLNGTPETPYPSCTELANTDTNGDGIAEHVYFGCGPPMR